MRNMIPWIVGGLVVLCSMVFLIPLFLSDRNQPTRANLAHPMPKWLLVLFAIWAALGGGAIVAVIVEGWLR